MHMSLFGLLRTILMCVNLILISLSLKANLQGETIDQW